MREPVEPLAQVAVDAINRTAAWSEARTLQFLNLLDVLTTVVGIRLGGFDEMNPICAWVLRVSPLGFVLGKIAVMGACSGVLAVLRGRRVLRVLIWAYLLVVALNCWQILISR